MAQSKADTTIDKLLNIIKSTNDDPQAIGNLIDAIEKTIPVKGRKRMAKKVDPLLNKQFQIKRINYEVTAKVIEFDKDINSYCVKVLTVEGETKVCPGTFLFISKRELELTGRPII